MDFSIRVFGGRQVADGIYLLITETTVNTWIIMGLLLLFAIIVRVKSRKWDPNKRPSGLQNVVEMMIDAFDRFFRGNSSEKVSYLRPWFFSLFTFLLISNMIGIIGLRPPTADWGMTLPLALSSFFLFQFAGLRHRPKAYLKGIFLEPVFLFAPLNVIGEIARPVSLSFRLFGNILGGMILVALLYSMNATVVSFLLPVPLHLIFDLALGLLQAVIFTVLSLTFVGIAAED